MGREQGFTLLELLIAVAISVIVAGVTYAAYSYQQRAFVGMRQVAEVQQNLRASMYLVEMGIKSARYDPTEAMFARILRADTGEFRYEADINGNANDFSQVALDASPTPDEPNERVRFSLKDSCDTDKNGIPDDGTPCELTRATWSGGGLPMADNIEVLNFVYLDGAGNVLGSLPLDNSTDAATLNTIQTIEVTIVARSAREDPRHVDRGMADPSDAAKPRGYFNLRGERLLDAPEDHYHRRALSRRVNCSNIIPSPSTGGGT